MRNMTMIFIHVILGLMAVAIVMTISGRMNRSAEVQSKLSAAVEHAVEQTDDNAEAVKSSEEAVAACIGELALMSDTDAELTVDIMEADADKGVIAIQIQERFRHPNGKPGKIQWSRTAIRNRKEKEQKEQYEVRFYCSKEEMSGGEACYKRYSVQEGERVLAPANPGRKDAVFACWKDSHDYIADFSQPVQQNLVYYAQWE